MASFKRLKRWMCSFTSADFRVRGDTVANMLFCDVSSDNIGIHTFPTGGGSTVQLNGDISHRTHIQSMTATGAAAAETQLNGTIVYDSGSAGVITVNGAGVQGDKVTIVSVGSGGATIAFQPGDSSVQTPASLSSGQSETWLCYKANNWVKVASS